jgi:2-polyprenyl-6-methoxyphenol hydroxylase-like FAD-dependent oxidoreductase
MPEQTSVIIVGGSLNGLTAALLLAHRGVPCVVVERHPQTTIQYKFRGISPRSMEIYRGLGIEAEIRARDQIDDTVASIARVKNLGASEVAWLGVPWAETADISPTRGATCDQDRLEPILRAHAERLGADVRFNTELVTLEQDEHGVRAHIRDRGLKQERTITAAYLIAADGSRSPVREALGISRHGPGILQHWMNVIFETDLDDTFDGRAIRAVFVTDINGTFVPRGDGRWLLAVQYFPEREGQHDLTNEHWRDIIRRGAGRSDVKAEIVDVRPWEAAANVADRFIDGRVFLVGDSAHVMPPTGGFGGNTGIQDAHNLAWKLQAVLQGAAGPGLLETYDQERRPVADRTLAQALARLQAWFKDPGGKLPPPEPIADDYAVVFGYRYPAGALVSDGSTADDMFENPREPSGRPGSRAAHLVVEHDGVRISTVDLFAGRWVLFAGPDGDVWRTLVNQSRARDDFGVQCYQIDDRSLRDVNNRWSAVFGSSADGAVLFRPDGVIAWRGRNSQPDTQSTLPQALDRLRFRQAPDEREA